MAISFNAIPLANRVPFVFAEFDGSNAVNTPQILRFRALLIGQKTSSGTAAANELVRFTSAAQAKTLFGAGSVLAGMAEAFLTQNTFTEVWAMPVADDGGAVAATGSISFAGTATAAGAIALMVAGRPVRAAVANGNNATAVATAVAAAINAVPDLPVTATALSDTVTVTAKNAGATGNDIDLRVNYHDGESTPAGLSVSITAMSGGATNPSLSAAIAALGDEWFQVIATAFRDGQSLADLKTEMDDRWGPIRQIDGHVIAAANGSVGDMTSLGSTLNDKHLVIVATQNSPTPAYEVAAETAAIVAYYASIDPARPLQTLAYQWMKAPSRGHRFTQTERNTLLYSGIATVRVSNAGTVMVERLVTTYRKNEADGDDPAYLDTETLMTLQYIRWDWRNYILNKYPRHKLADDGTRYAPGQAIVTPSLIKAEAIAKFQDWEAQGLVEGFDQFKRDLIVERNPNDRNRVDVLMPPDLVNQFRVCATKISFLL
jgi:phage tail sheath gpL-like